MGMGVCGHSGQTPLFLSAQCSPPLVPLRAIGRMDKVLKVSENHTLVISPSGNR